MRTTEIIPITKTPPGKTGTWNDHQLEQLFGEALGDISTADETRKACIHSSVVTVSDTNLSDG